jgi:hypothetical protein
LSRYIQEGFVWFWLLSSVLYYILPSLIIFAFKVTLPLYPPPFDKGGGNDYLRGAAPLLDALHIDERG